ncbi:serine hydrolase domain-containing protein [Alicyclobacillus dauci]|uniref:Beta-lactamase family protein n=1 Tax=Alicyclobacillus dauci TaxID=1475485 RepID=A0ABY6Z2W8_9BACL|nr:serine hydrolase domain-containing protein [Alicyclobacillus dauci]WAH37187.1 beta-lactamase family protein [Alicyclobacillus dauci]
MRIDMDHLKLVDHILHREVEAGRLPGAVYAVGMYHDIWRQNAVGYAETLHGINRPVHPDTIFDLASLTKVVATLPSVLLLIDEGEIRLEDPVSMFLPAFAHPTSHESAPAALAKAKAQVTIRHLLTHSSGLPSHRTYYQTCANREEVIQKVLTEPLEALPGTQVVYSDLGFVLLGEIVEAVSGMRIDEFAAKRIFQPLSMNETTYRPRADLRTRIAATEEFEGIVKVGVVHDENTHAMDGVSGHAGLFAPMDDMVRYVQMWLAEDATVLSPAVRRAAVTCFTMDLNGRRALGWTCRHDSYDHTGDLWPASTVAHTGFTGTSMAFDPASGLWMVLLTNEVHYGRENRTIGRLRNRLHNLVAAALHK